MKMKLIMVLAGALAFSNVAIATEKDKGHHGGGNQSQGQGQVQAQLQGQSQQMGQSQFSVNSTEVGNGYKSFSPTATASSGDAKAYGGNASASAGASSYSNADSGGNALTLNQNVPAPNLREGVPGIALGSLYPSAPCMGTSNIGGSGPGFSIGFGSSWVSEECNIRETARMAPTEADRVFVWCQTAAAKGAPSCKALAKKAETNESATRYTANGVTWSRADVYSNWTRE